MAFYNLTSSDTPALCGIPLVTQTPMLLRLVTQTLLLMCGGGLPTRVVPGWATEGALGGHLSATHGFPMLQARPRRHREVGSLA